jgi:DNA-binding FrmR family transcriptional regulator
VAHTIRGQKKLLTRIRRIKGQAEALEKALGQDAECSAVLQQIAAIRGAVNGLMAEVLEGHIREHLGRADASPQQRGEDVEQVVSALHSYLR